MLFLIVKGTEHEARNAAARRRIAVWSAEHDPAWNQTYVHVDLAYAQSVVQWFAEDGPTDAGSLLFYTQR